MRHRRIWLLKHRRAGDLAQMRNLASMLRDECRSEGDADWAIEEKQLVFHYPKLARYAPAARWLLDRKASDSLEPPWPDAIVMAEACITWVAKGLKARAGDKTKVIVVGRPAGKIKPFDLILTTAQYGLPAAPNVVSLPVPLAAFSSAPAGERTLLLERMEGKPRPWIAVLIGGSVPPDNLNQEAIAQIVEAARGKAQASGGSLIILTSPRTGKACEEVIRGLQPAAGLLQLWTTTTGPNLYRAVMAEADDFLVTSDSISMTVEALTSGKRVSVFMLPQRSSLALRTVSALNRFAGIAVKNPHRAWRLAAPLFEAGILEAPAERLQFYRELTARGVLAIHPDSPVRLAAPVIKEAHVAAVKAMRMLLA
jgi:uncharacterized protein